MSEKCLDEKLKFNVVHRVNGRLRISIPLLVSQSTLTGCVSLLISKWEGVKDVQSNYICGSIAIYYDTNIIKEELLLEQISRIVLEDCVYLKDQIILPKKEYNPLTLLKKTAFALFFTLIFSNISFLILPMSLVLFVLILPIYKQALKTLLYEHKLSIKLMYIIPLTIWLISGRVIVLSIVAVIIYFGDYMTEMADHKVTLFGFENYRFVRIIIGFTLLVIGIPLIPLPGPGIVVTTVALNLLSHEFLWAKQFLHKFKQFFKKGENKV